eukprot:5324830-Pleurochrysis_carterae.AAC.5
MPSTFASVRRPARRRSCPPLMCLPAPPRHPLRTSVHVNMAAPPFRARARDARGRRNITADCCWCERAEVSKAFAAACRLRWSPRRCGCCICARRAMDWRRGRLRGRSPSEKGPLRATSAVWRLPAQAFSLAGLPSRTESVLPLSV